MHIIKWLHRWFPGLCARDTPLVFVGNEIRCPTCSRLLAYRYPVPRGQGRYHVHVCYPFAFNLFDVKAAAIRDPPYEDPDPYNIEETIALIHSPPDVDWDTGEKDEGFSDPGNDPETFENIVDERT